MRSWRQVWVVATTAAALWGAPAVAQNGEGAEALAITAENIMAGDARHQALAERGGDPNALFPGDIVHYRLVFTNVTGAPVRRVEFRDPLPGGLRYVAGSAASDRDDIVIEYSIDGGASFLVQPMIEEIIDGERVQKPAPPERYTDVRWRVTGWVQPDAHVLAEFRAELPQAVPVLQTSIEEPGNGQASLPSR